MGNNKISIIVPIYNAEKFLKKCIESIINQTYNNLEIILVNDGSIDKSLDICQMYSYKDDRIIVVDKKNGGLSSARNAGIEITTGDFIGFVDSDDYISPYMYEKLCFAIENANAEVAECGYYRVSENGEVSERKLENDQTAGKYQCSYNFLSNYNTTNTVWNKLFKKNLFKKTRYPAYEYSEDYVINSKIFYECEKKVTISDCLYYYIQNPKSITNKPFTIKKLDIIYAGNEVYNFYKSKDIDLCKLTIVYILNNIRRLYKELMQTDVNGKDKIEKILINEYKEKYPLINDDLYKTVKHKKTILALWIFYRTPKLYCFIEKIRVINK